jgi:cyclopropane-fatty-acyl-phospholipid synthase
MRTLEQSSTNQHYDRNPELFVQFLDPYLKYSSGYYSTTDISLAQAQENKIDFICDLLGLTAGQSLLDIGCGWGSLVIGAAERRSLKTYGITPAPRQAAFVRSRIDERELSAAAHVTVGTFEDYDSSRSFDGITFVGSIIHLPDLAGAFVKAKALTRRNGTLYVSETCFRSHGMRQRFGEVTGTKYVRDDIFGWGDMRPLSELVRCAEDAGWSIRDVVDLTEDYYRTIEAWIVNAKRNSATIDRLFDGGTEALIRYFETANAGWGYTTKHYAIVCANTRR